MLCEKRDRDLFIVYTKKNISAYKQNKLIYSNFMHWSCGFVDNLNLCMRARATRKLHVVHFYSWNSSVEVMRGASVRGSVVKGTGRVTNSAGDSHHLGITKSCRLSWLTNSALVYEPNAGAGVAGSQPMRQQSTWSPNKLWKSNSIFLTNCHPSPPILIHRFLMPDV